MLEDFQAPAISEINWKTNPGKIKTVANQFQRIEKKLIQTKSQAQMFLDEIEVQRQKISFFQQQIISKDKFINKILSQFQPNDKQSLMNLSSQTHVSSIETMDNVMRKLNNDNSQLREKLIKDNNDNASKIVTLKAKLGTMHSNFQDILNRHGLNENIGIPEFGDFSEQITQLNEKIEQRDQTIAQEKERHKEQESDLEAQIEALKSEISEKKANF